MAIAKELQAVDPFCMQSCPFCQRMNRIVMKGTYVKNGKMELYPDMGYSFCNCKNMFYTRLENVIEKFSYEPINGIITAPDPFFAWPNPYDFQLWNIRKYEVIWPMDSLIEHLKEKGYEIVSAWKDFELNSLTPQHYHIKVERE